MRKPTVLAICSLFLVQDTSAISLGANSHRKWFDNDEFFSEDNQVQTQDSTYQEYRKRQLRETEAPEDF